MKYLILVVLLLGILFLSPGIKEAKCVDCEDYIGKRCYSDFQCGQPMCYLSCVEISVFKRICR